MRKAVKEISVLILIPVLILALIVVLVRPWESSDPLLSPESTRKAREILEKMAKKYNDVLIKNDVRSIEARVSVSASGELPIPKLGAMPISNIEVTAELYVVKPDKIYLSAAFKNADFSIIIVKRNESVKIILPNTKQYANITDMPELGELIPLIEGNQGNRSEILPRIEDLWNEATPVYEGVMGMARRAEKSRSKVHRIRIIPKDPSKAASKINIYVIDRIWDPMRVEYSGEKGSFDIWFAKLNLNAKIPDKKFVFDTKGFTEISKDELGRILMQQLPMILLQSGSGSGLP